MNNLHTNFVKIFEPNSECFAKYDAFCSHIFDYACLWRIRLIAIEEVRNHGKIVYIKNFSKMAFERMHTPHATPMAISYRNHQKSLAYFSHLAPLILFLFTKRPRISGRGGGACILHTLLRALHLFRDMIIIGKESTIAFSATDKLVTLF